jgi:hypothetical protein
MKKILAIAAVAAMAAGVSAYAANPFSDVSTDDWAYQAVSDLSDQGIVEGYPDGTFRGERNITRYELAQIIARLMANEDQYNAEQRATIDKLAGEYADELNNLGVRVSNLEAKVGNLYWSGDARMRLVQDYDDEGDANTDFDGRMRIRAHAQVNDSTYVEGLLRADMDFTDAKDDNDEDDVYMQRLFVHHDFGDRFGVNLGKYAEFAGQTGVMFDDEVRGIEGTYGTDTFNVTVGYGRFDGWEDPETKDNYEVTYARLAGDTARLAWDVEYYNGASDVDFSTWGAGLTWRVTDDFDIFGDYYQNTDYDDDPTLWTAGLGYGHTDLSRPGTWRLAAQYVRAERGAYLGGTTFDVSDAQDVVLDDWDSDTDSLVPGADSVHFWLAAADVVLAKNVNLHAEYAFDVSADGTDTDYDDLATVSLQYSF